MTTTKTSGTSGLVDARLRALAWFDAQAGPVSIEKYTSAGILLTQLWAHSAERDTLLRPVGDGLREITDLGRQHLANGGVSLTT